MPSFLITIDTEGDNLWARPERPSTINAAYLPRFQSLCERYGLKPTYLTSFEMAGSKLFQDFARDVIHEQTGEIGMHLHAWHTPPMVNLTSNDSYYMPYLMEYPEHLMLEKIVYLTKFLENTFQVKMFSHRAGRWGINPVYVRLLIEQGYRVDCSVTPHVSWRKFPGDPQQLGGSDFSRFPEFPFFLDPLHMDKPGNSTLLELPMTIIQRKTPVDRLKAHFRPHSYLHRKFNKHFPSLLWLRPSRGNLKRLLTIIDTVLEEGRPYAEFMLHSSELMPGGSPNFRSEKEIERLYEDLETLFGSVRDTFVGRTLREYHDTFLRAIPGTQMPSPEALPKTGPK
jgi:hypothetical protein